MIRTPGLPIPWLAVAAAALCLALVSTETAADVVQPVSVQIREQEPGAFLVQWQVPKAIPYAAMQQGKLNLEKGDAKVNVFADRILEMESAGT